MAFKFDEEKINKELTIETLKEANILPEDLPDLVLKVRDLLMQSKGYSKWEQERYQRYLYKVENNLIEAKEEEEAEEEAGEKPVAIKVENVTKIYDLSVKKKGQKKVKKKFYALDDISFEVKQGEVMGLFGTNGSGKSTISLLIAGMSDYDTGNITVNGSRALIPARVGLKNEITGEENIEFKCALMGMRKKDVEKVKKDVIEYAELGDHMYTPVKKYSSGMKARLGFAISLALKPDIYILDEVLSVGDKAFKQKCFDTMKALREDGSKTILFISHSIKEIQDFCTKTVWIEAGHLIEAGKVDVVARHYNIYTNYLAELPKEVKDRYLEELASKRDLTIEQWKERQGIHEEKSFAK